MKNLFLLVALITAPLFADSSYIISCFSHPGSRVCRQMEDVQNSFNYTCTGYVCYSIWQRQIDEMNRFSQSVRYDLPYSFLADYEVGQLAWYVNDKICRSTATGDVNWMTAGEGIAHSERSPIEDRNLERSLHGIQIWVALPKEKPACAASGARRRV